MEHARVLCKEIPLCFSLLVEGPTGPRHLCHFRSLDACHSRPPPATPVSYIHDTNVRGSLLSREAIGRPVDRPGFLPPLSSPLRSQPRLFRLAVPALVEFPLARLATAFRAVRARDTLHAIP